MKKIISILLALSILGKNAAQAEIAYSTGSYSTGDAKVKHANLMSATDSSKEQIMQDLQQISDCNLTEQYLSLDQRTLKTFAAVLYKNIPSVFASEVAEAKGVYKKPITTDEEQQYHRFLSVFVSLSDLNAKDIDLWRALPLVQEFEQTLLSDTSSSQNENKSLEQIVKNTIIDCCNKIKNTAPAMIRKFAEGLDILPIVENTLFTIPLEDFESPDPAKYMQEAISVLGKLDSKALKNALDHYMSQMKHINTLYSALLEKFNTQIRDEFNQTVSSAEQTSVNRVNIAISSFINTLSNGSIILTDNVTSAMLKVIRSVNINGLLAMLSNQYTGEISLYDTSSAEWQEGISVLRSIKLKGMILSKLKIMKAPASEINKISKNKELDNITLDDELSAMLYNAIYLCADRQGLED